MAARRAIDSQRRAARAKPVYREMADAARREGEIEAREQAARQHQELRNQLEAARPQADRAKSEALRAAREEEQKTQSARAEDQKNMVEALDRLKGQAEGHIRSNAIANQAVSEENRRLKSDLEQRRIEKEVYSKTAQTTHVETPPYPTCCPA
eukprot:8743315-Pyramimonas_sp.AAC.1